MKTCNNCNIEKPYSEYQKDKNATDGYQYKCKQCQREYRINNRSYFINYHQSRTLPYWIVYLLPKHNYIGITNKPHYRMLNHKNNFNRDTSGWVELHRFDTREEALAKEAEYHLAGYNGRQGNLKKSPT